MADFKACSLSLNEELRLIITNDIKKLESANPSISETERLEHLENLVNRLSAEKVLEINKQAKITTNLIKNIEDNYQYLSKGGKRNGFLNENIYQKLLEGVYQINTKHGYNARFSVEALSKAKRNDFAGIIDDNLQKIEHYANGKNINVETEAGALLNNDIFKEYAILNGSEGQSTGNTLAKEYAVAMKKSFDAIKKQHEALGYKNFGSENFNIVISHNRTALQNAKFEGWLSKVGELIDTKKLPFLSEGNPNSNKMARTLFDYFAGNRTDMEFNGIPIHLKEEMRKVKETGQLPFKDIDSLIKYNNEFGAVNNAVDNLKNISFRSALQLSEKSILGEESEKTFKSIVNYFATKNFDEGKKFNAGAIFDKRDKVMERIGVENINLARGSSNLRNLGATTIYGSTVINAAAFDRINQALYNSFNKSDYGGLLLNLAKAIPQGISDLGQLGFRAIDFSRKGGLNVEERSYLNKLGLASETISHMTRQMIEEADSILATGRATNIVNGISKGFSRASGLDAYTNMQRANFYQEKGKELLSQLNAGWNKIDKLEQGQWLKYGISEKDFSILQNIKDFAEKTPFGDEGILTHNLAYNLTDTQLKPFLTKDLLELKQIKESAGDILTQQDVSQFFNNYREVLRNKLQTLFNTEAHITFGYSDTRAQFYGKAKAGTVLGESLRFMAQAKTYPILLFDNLFRNIYYNVEKGASEKFATLTAFVGTSIVAGIITEQVNSILNNKTPEEMSSELLAKSIARAGVGGLAGDVGTNLFKEVFNKDKSGSENVSTFAKNSFKFMLGSTGEKTFDLASAMLIGIKDGNTDPALKSIKNATPNNNLWWLKGFVNYTTMQISQAVGGDMLQNEKNRLATQRNFFNDNSRTLLFDPMER